MSQHWNDTGHDKPPLLTPEGKIKFIFHVVYHCCWSPGDEMIQVISNNYIELIIPEYYVNQLDRF